MGRNEPWEDGRNKDFIPDTFMSVLGYKPRRAQRKTIGMNA
jgi:hypothetical protein